MKGVREKSKRRAREKTEDGRANENKHIQRKFHTFSVPFILLVSVRSLHALSKESAELTVLNNMLLIMTITTCDTWHH